MYHRFGTVDVLQWEEIGRPTLGSGQAWIHIRAVSLNLLDAYVRSGRMGSLVSNQFPKIPGADFSGVVAAVAPDIRGLAVGEQVFGTFDPLVGGALAEGVVIAASTLAAKPKTLSFMQAAAVPFAGLAALQAVRDLAQLKSGDALLVHGASSGLGLFAIQLAKRVGAHVTAVAATSALPALLTAGADVLIDSSCEDDRFDSQRYDAILNSESALSFDRAQSYLKPSGRFLVPWPMMSQSDAFELPHQIVPSKRHLVLHPVVRANDLAFLGSLIDAGGLEVTVARVYGREEVQEGYRQLEGGSSVGKIVINLDGR